MTVTRTERLFLVFCAAYIACWLLVIFLHPEWLVLA